MNDNLALLKALTDRLPELDEFETPIGGPAVSLRGRDGGMPSFGFGVHRDKDIGIMRMFTPKGGVVDSHRHSGQHEWVGVISGKMELMLLDTGESVTVNAFDAVHIGPNRPHAILALEDTWTWSISMPPAAGYPDVTGCPFAKKEPGRALH